MRAHRRAGGAAVAGRGALTSVHDAAQEGRSWCAQAQAVQLLLAEAHRPRRDLYAVEESFCLKSWLEERRTLKVMVYSHTPSTEGGWAHVRRRRRSSCRWQRRTGRAANSSLSWSPSV